MNNWSFESLPHLEIYIYIYILISPHFQLRKKLHRTKCILEFANFCRQIWNVLWNFFCSWKCGEIPCHRIFFNSQFLQVLAKNFGVWPQNSISFFSCVMTLYLSGTEFWYWFQFFIYLRFSSTLIRLSKKQKNFFYFSEVFLGDNLLPKYHRLRVYKYNSL